MLSREWSTFLLLVISIVLQLTQRRGSVFFMKIRGALLNSGNYISGILEKKLQTPNLMAGGHQKLARRANFAILQSFNIKVAVPLLLFKIILPIFLLLPQLAFAETIIVGSKKFTESYILAEVFAQFLESHDYKVERRLGLGGTLIAFKALEEKAIHIYPEYSGTVEETILKQNHNSDREAINKGLEKFKVESSSYLGFNNTYALAVTKQTAEKYKLKKISDLQGQSLSAVFAYEFLKRKDGWENLKKTYQLNKVQARGIEHELSYAALESGSADLMVVYSTDAKIKKFNLVLLEDDKSFFPKYYSLALMHKNMPKKAKEILEKLSGKITQESILELNASVTLEGKSFAEAAAIFLEQSGLVKVNKSQAKTDSQVFVERIRQHLFLTFIAILFAVLVAVPVAVLLLKLPKLAEVTLIFAGLLQTIPSIALLAFMIPFFGIGSKPAIIGLFLYSILPILRNTYVALNNIEDQYLESAQGIGLSFFETLRYVRLPLGVPIIIAGVRTAAVINIGTATLAAFIGAGGLGEYIVTGLSLNDTELILKGAIPAALLAICVEIVFSFCEKKLSKV